MSRARVLTGRVVSDNEQTMTQAWHSLVDTIRLLPSGPTGDDKRAVMNEKATLDSALDQLGALIDLRKGGNGRDGTPRMSPAPGHEVMTPPGSGGVKRKRRLSVSISASPAPQGGGPAPHTGGSESALSSIPSPFTAGRAGTPLGGREAKAARRGDGISDQLPLRAGRRVAVKQKLTTGTGKKDENADEGDWILATVKKMIGGDKLKYEVQDADDGTRWITTLRSILLLPDPDAAPHLSSHPNNLEDFGRGTQVLALYPDTTSFYRATVVSPPIPGTGMGLGVRNGSSRSDAGAKAGQYRLSFVDDGDNIHDVDKDLVVLFPKDR